MMTLEEWSTCDEAWWWLPHLPTKPVRVVFTNEPVVRGGGQVRRYTADTMSWNFIGEKYWYSTEAEVMFYAEVLQ